MIPQNIINGFKKLADKKNYISVNRIADMEQSLVQGERKYLSLLIWLTQDAVGKKFLEVYGTGFYIKDLENFNPKSMRNNNSIESSIKTDLDKYTVDTGDHDVNEFIYQLRKKYDVNSALPVSEIKNLQISSPKFQKLLSKPSVKKIMLDIHNGKIKSIQDIISQYDSTAPEKSLNKLSIKDIDVNLKDYKATAHSYFKNDAKYIYTFSLNKNAFDELQNVLSAYPGELNYLGHPLSYSQLVDVYANHTTVHSVSNIAGKFGIGWVRFVVKDINGEKVVIIEEVQSDLMPIESPEDYDMYKVCLPKEIFDSMFGSTKELYFLMMKSFIKYVRGTLGYKKIYAPSYDIKAAVAQAEVEDEDFSSYKYLSPEDVHKLKTMKPPMFPYKEIIPAFHFSKVDSDLPGFLVLESAYLPKHDYKDNFDYKSIKIKERKTGKSLGNIAYYSPHGFSTPTVEISAVVIKPEHRNNGIGTAILLEFAKKIRETMPNIKQFVADCLSKQSLRMFIKAYGKPEYMADNIREYKTVNDAMVELPDTAIEDGKVLTSNGNVIFVRYNLNKIKLPT